MFLKELGIWLFSLKPNPEPTLQEKRTLCKIQRDPDLQPNQDNVYTGKEIFYKWKTENCTASLWIQMMVNKKILCTYEGKLVFFGKKIRFVSALDLNKKCRKQIK